MPKSINREIYTVFIELYVFFKYPVCFEVLLDEKVSECFLSIKYK